MRCSRADRGGPTAEEVEANPRSPSARCAAEKLRRPGRGRATATKPRRPVRARRVARGALRHPSTRRAAAPAHAAPAAEFSGSPRFGAPGRRLSAARAPPSSQASPSAPRHPAEQRHPSRCCLRPSRLAVGVVVVCAGHRPTIVGFHAVLAQNQVQIDRIRGEIAAADDGTTRPLVPEQRAGVAGADHRGAGRSGSRGGPAGARSRSRSRVRCRSGAPPPTDENYEQVKGHLGLPVTSAWSAARVPAASAGPCSTGRRRPAACHAAAPRRPRRSRRRRQRPGGCAAGDRLPSPPALVGILALVRGVPRCSRAPRRPPGAGRASPPQLGRDQRIKEGALAAEPRRHLRPQRSRPRGVARPADDLGRPRVIEHPAGLRRQARADRAASTRSSCGTPLATTRRSSTSRARSTRRRPSPRRRLDLPGVLRARVEALLPVGYARRPGARVRRTRQQRARRARGPVRTPLAGRRVSSASSATRRAATSPAPSALVAASAARRRPRAHHRPVDPVRRPSRCSSTKWASRNAKGGMAIVTDVRTGDILAMANVDGETADIPRSPRRRLGRRTAP